MADGTKEASAGRPQIRKAIPEPRDRWQSRLIVVVLATAIVVCSVVGFLATSDEGGRYKVTGISLLFALLVGLMRSATIGGAVCGALACFCMTWWTRDLESPLLHSALLPLVILFLLTFATTRAGRKAKQMRGLAERKGGRTAAQVLANLGAAALAVTPIGAYAAVFAGIPLPISAKILATACVAALAEATADTVSSEVGQAFGQRTYMLTTFRRVHRGTDGGVSKLGTFAGASAALLVVLAGGRSLHLAAGAQAVALAAGLLGVVFDSLLGATVERRGWIGNDLVNLSSTVVSAFGALLLLRLTSTIP